MPLNGLRCGDNLIQASVFSVQRSGLGHLHASANNARRVAAHPPGPGFFFFCPLLCVSGSDVQCSTSGRVACVSVILCTRVLTTRLSTPIAIGPSLRNEYRCELTSAAWTRQAIEMFDDGNASLLEGWCQSTFSRDRSCVILSLHL